MPAHQRWSSQIESMPLPRTAAVDLGRLCACLGENTTAVPAHASRPSAYRERQNGGAWLWLGGRCDLATVVHHNRILEADDEAAIDFLAHDHVARQQQSDVRLGFERAVGKWRIEGTEIAVWPPIGVSSSFWPSRRWVFRSRVAADAAVQEVKRQGTWSGLNSVELCLRLLRETAREFARCHGALWQRLMAELRNLRAAVEKTPAGGAWSRASARGSGPTTSVPRQTAARTCGALPWIAHCRWG